MKEYATKFTVCYLPFLLQYIRVSYNNNNNATFGSKALTIVLSTFYDKSERDKESSQFKKYKYVPLGFNHGELEQIDIQFTFVLGRVWSHLS